MRQNDKFLKPGTGKELPRTTTDNAGMVSVKPIYSGKKKPFVPPRMEAIKKIKGNR